MIRNIQKTDNETLAQIIRTSLKSYGLDIPGTVYTDPTTDDLFKLFQTPGSVYFVFEAEGKILGGCGIYPTEGLPKGCAELVKLYLTEESRGKGLGKMLMEKSCEWARDFGYTYLYLETFEVLNSAVGLYNKIGFKNLDSSLGNSGHHACEIWMLKDLRV